MIAIPEFIRDDLQMRAFTQYVIEMHHGQARKYTNVPYATHPIAVASILYAEGITSKDILMAALGHDLIEDTDADQNVIVDLSSQPTLDMIYDVSSLHEGKRKTRMRLFAEQVAAAPYESRVIKFADTLDNMSSIKKYDPKFAITYAEEKRGMIALCDRADRARDKPGTPVFEIYRKLRREVISIIDNIHADLF